MNYRSRTRRLQNELVTRGWDMALLTSPEVVRYLSGYHGFTRSPRAVMLPAVGEPTLLIVESDIRLGASMSPMRTKPYPLDGRGFASLIATCRKLKDEIDGRGNQWCVEYDSVPVQWRDTIVEQLEVQLADISLILGLHRSVKAPEETEQYRHAAALAVRGMKAAIETLAVGVSETAVKSAIDTAIFAEAACQWPDAVVESETNVVSGDKIDRLHAMATGRRLGRGEPGFVIEGVSCNGYWANVARTLWVGGSASRSEHGRALVMIQEAFGTACASLKLGETLQKAVEAADHVLSTVGLGGRRIYPMFRGLGLTKYERPNLGDLANPLLPNMCFCAQLYVRLDDAILGISDSVLITNERAEVLTTDADW